MTGGAAVSGTAFTAAHPERAVDLVLARVHLRTGSLGLARAELEAMAGRGALDDAGLLDLAEARWRTGDLSGAGEAAQAYLATGDDSTLALVMAAEATLALGRPGEARTLVGRALEGFDGSLDAVFAGMPRSAIWPSERLAPEVAPGVQRPDAADGDGFGVGAPVHVAAAASPHAPADREAPAHESLPDPAAVLAAGRAALAAGDVDVALAALGLALRLGPGFASAILEMLEPVESSVAVTLLRGDALRAAGHEAEAVAAYAGAARALAEAPEN